MAMRKAVIIQEDDGELFVGDIVEYEGSWWLALGWTHGPTLDIECPTIIVSLSGLFLKPAPEQYRDRADLILESPMTKAVLEGRELMPGRAVIVRPNIIRSVAKTTPEP
jgi:hypothetical protein